MVSRSLPGDDIAASDFFQRIEDNLREGQVRLVFFLARAPAELKSIVEFLNDQMDRAEVLIVEARQVEIQGMRLVAPSLFGFRAADLFRAVIVRRRGHARRAYGRVVA